MNNSIRTLKQEQNLTLWAQQVEECNNSGLSMSQWCRNNNIPVSTYSFRQKKVWEAFSKRQASNFVEVTVQQEAATPSIAVSISSGNIVADVHNGADEDTITAVLRAMKNA